MLLTAKHILWRLLDWKTTKVPSRARERLEMVEIGDGRNNLRSSQPQIREHHRHNERKIEEWSQAEEAR